MGQSSVILVIAAVLTVGILAFAAQRSTGDADLELAQYHEKVLAREASFTGINMTVRRLVDDPDSWYTADASPNDYEYTDESYYGATFTTTVVYTDVDLTTVDTVDIVSTGVDAGATTHVIEATYAKGYISGGVPPSFRYAIIAEEDLTLNGQAHIATVNEDANANIHANGDLTVNGSNVVVEGYGTYSPDGSGTVNPEKAVDDVFDPNVDENGSDSNMYGGEDIEIQEIDANDYNTSPPATVVTISDTTLSGVIDLQQWATSLGYGPEVGTAESPFLLYIEGVLSTSGDVTILGYGQLVANGEVRINGDVLATTQPEPDSDASDEEYQAWMESNLDEEGNTKLGIYSTFDIDVNGGVTVAAQLYANGTINLNGGGGEETNIIGALTATNLDINVNGGVNIHYAQMSEKILLPGFEYYVPEGVRLIAWAEF